jgi:hypothetical protein
LQKQVETVFNAMAFVKAKLVHLRSCRWATWTYRYNWLKSVFRLVPVVPHPKAVNYQKAK